MTTNYDFDDRQSPTSIAIGNHRVQKAIDRLSDCWNIFLPNDIKYWLHYDRNQRHLQSSAEHGSQDMFLLWPLWANLFLDLLIFHSLAEYLIQHLLPNAPPWTIFLATLLFPCVYMATEFKFAQLIYAARMASRNEPFSKLLTFWVIFWYIEGFCWAVLPSAVFAYVMHLSQQDNELSWIFVAILTLLGVLLHLLIVFGGEPVIDAKTRWFARCEDRRLAKKRLESYRSVRRAAGQTKSITSHYAQIAAAENMTMYFLGLTESASSIIKFIDRECYSLHPLDREIEYRFGKYRSREKGDRLVGD
jgi:hypothetical protein